MLKVGETFHGRDSLAKIIESHGMSVGKKAKFIRKLSGGNGIHYKCLSFDEEVMDCGCSFSVYFAKSRKKSDNIKEYDENGQEIDNSVWFIPLKSKMCITHTCDETSSEIEELTPNLTIKQIDWNAYSAKYNLYNFRNIYDESNSASDDSNVFKPFAVPKSFEVPKLKLTFNASEKSDEKYCHFKHSNKSNRIPKLIRATTNPSQTPQKSDENIKSELAILLEELDLQYSTLTINAPKNDAPSPPDPIIVAREKEIADVKLAIQAKFEDKLFMFDEITINTEKSGKKSDCWNLESDIESWRCNSKWWDVCISNFPLGKGLNVVGWDHDNNRFSLYYNDYFSMARCDSVKYI